MQIKHSKVQEDSELFAMYTTLVEESVEVVSSHIAELTGQMTPIIEKGIAEKEEWVSSTINQEVDIVWNLILSGIVK